MNEMRTLSVEVAGETAATIDEMVASGRFATEADVLTFALLLFGDWVRDQAGSEPVEPNTADDRLVRSIATGFASGNPVEATDAFFHSIKVLGRARFEQLRAAE